MLQTIIIYWVSLGWWKTTDEISIQMRPVLGSEQSRMCHIEQNNILAKSFFLMAALTYLGCTHEDNMTIEQGYIIYIEIIYILLLLLFWNHGDGTPNRSQCIYRVFEMQSLSFSCLHVQLTHQHVVVVPAFAGMPKLPDGNPFQRRQTFPSWRCWMISTSSSERIAKKKIAR